VKLHALNDQVTKNGGAALQAKWRAVAQQFDVTLRAEHIDPLTDGAVAAKPGLVLELLGKLLCSEQTSCHRFVEQ